MSQEKPMVLVILDGWGHQPEQSNNAIGLTPTPTWDRLWANCPHTLLSGSGPDVGLPVGQMGNSEVGHLTLGSGRVIDQALTQISKAIKDRQFFEQAAWQPMLAHLKASGQALHIMGLVSPGGIHSHQEHILALLELAHHYGLQRIYLHAFLDGRDTPPQSADASLALFEQWFAQHDCGQIASLSGRYYAMDRDNRYERTQLAYQAITGQAQYNAATALAGLQAAYQRQETDEFVTPTTVHLPTQAPIQVVAGDAMVFMNFRADRARQLSYAFTQPEFNHFARGPQIPLSHFLSLTQYAPDLNATVVFAPQHHAQGLGETLQNHQLTQLRLAETEKYAHVTFFFNGGIDLPFKGESRILVPSPKVATYDLQPQMSAVALTDHLIDAIYAQQHDVIIINYANADMVGHTGHLSATQQAIATLDHCLARLTQALNDTGGAALITADHGNAECMLNSETQQPHTAHTVNPVPLLYVGPQVITFNQQLGTLADVAPTLLALLGITIPAEMTGNVLFSSNVP
jgi:2,3-bisphosphoglycerate-independent phosphoglycerate mutase